MSKVLAVIRFFIRAYKNHWLASPAGMIAALVSTLSAAVAMIPLSLFTHAYFDNSSYAITANSIIGPLLAYFVYLTTYYGLMFAKERHELLADDLTLDKEKLRKWLRVVKYDYLAHLPSDAYLIPLAGLMQAGLEAGGMHIFWAVVLSQGADDLITFLKEPALWSGAKEVVAWEEQKDTTLLRALLTKFERKADTK